MFGLLEEVQPLSDEEKMDTNTGYQPTYHEVPAPYGMQTNWDWEETYKSLSVSPVLYNMDTYISPYPTNNWGNPSGILAMLNDESRLPAIDQKIDPNRIFNSDLAALRALASDQQKIVKLFDKRLTESLSEKGKVGLTEEEIEAMQALTAARSAITGISKEQANIKKSIAELRIKQQQNIAKANALNGGDGSGQPMSSVTVGRSIMDSIFDTSGQNISGSYNAPTYSDGNDLLGDVVNADTSINQMQYENMNPTTYVVLGDTDDDVEFATYADDGTLLPDYPNPTSIIEKIDRDAMIAIDDLMVSYPIRNKDD